MNEIKLKPIGFVSSPITEHMDENWGEIKSRIILKPEFAGALLGLVGNDYLEIKGLDAVNETPILDIKPYYPHYDKVDFPKVPEWLYPPFVLDYL